MDGEANAPIAAESGTIAPNAEAQNIPTTTVNLRPSTPSSSALTEFSPEAHSWILVPEASLSSLGATPPPSGHTPPISPLVPHTVPPSPKSLREDMALAGDLAVSEILSAESRFPVPPSTQSPPPPPTLAGSNESCNEPAIDAFFSHDADHATHEARKLGAIGFPPLLGKSAGSTRGKGGAEDDANSEVDLLDELLDPLICWGHAWARPFAVVAILVASHAACLLIGCAIGKAQSRIESATASAAADGAYLARRFSSGACGAHARICAA